MEMEFKRRIAEVGLEGLSEAELLTLFLKPGVSWERASEASGNLLSHLRVLQELREVSLGELREAGLSEIRAASFLAARELVRRSARSLLPLDRSFRSSQEVFAFFRPLLRLKQKETFWSLLLDGKNRVRRLLRISEGSLNRSLVHPREVFRPAIRESAAGVLFVHNHPSGMTEPSREDIEITQRLVETGRVVGIRVLDHVIIGAYRYFSFADAGML